MGKPHQPILMTPEFRTAYVAARLGAPQRLQRLLTVGREWMLRVPGHIVVYWKRQTDLRVRIVEYPRNRPYQASDGSQWTDGPLCVNVVPAALSEDMPQWVYVGDLYPVEEEP